MTHRHSPSGSYPGPPSPVRRRISQFVREWEYTPESPLDDLGESGQANALPLLAYKPFLGYGSFTYC